MDTGHHVERLFTVGGDANLITFSFRMAASDWILAGMSSTARRRLLFASRRAAFMREEVLFSFTSGSRASRREIKALTCCSNLPHALPSDSESFPFASPAAGSGSCLSARHLLHDAFRLLGVNGSSSSRTRRRCFRGRQRGAHSTTKSFSAASRAGGVLSRNSFPIAFSRLSGTAESNERRDCRHTFDCVRWLMTCRPAARRFA